MTTSEPLARCSRTPAPRRTPATLAVALAHVEEALDRVAVCMRGVAQVARRAWREHDAILRLTA
jgi:hypothetical protein